MHRKYIESQLAANLHRYSASITSDAQPGWPTSWDTKASRPAKNTCSLSNVLVCLHDAATGAMLHCDRSKAVTGECVTALAGTGGARLRTIAV